MPTSTAGRLVLILEDLFSSPIRRVFGSPLSFGGSGRDTEGRGEPAYPPLFDLLQTTCGPVQKAMHPKIHKDRIPCLNSVRRIQWIQQKGVKQSEYVEYNSAFSSYLGPFPATGSLFQCFPLNETKTKGFLLGRRVLWTFCRPSQSPLWEERSK
jgi:hypothetical protein